MSEGATYLRAAYQMWRISTEMKISRGGIKFNGKTKAEPLVVCHPWDNPSILKWGENSRGWVKISWGKSKGEPLLGVTPCPHLPSLEEIHLPVFRYLADELEMPYLAMLRKVEKWSWFQIRNPVNTKIITTSRWSPQPHLPSLVDIHGHVRELTCS